MQSPTTPAGALHLAVRPWLIVGAPPSLHIADTSTSPSLHASASLLPCTMRRLDGPAGPTAPACPAAPGGPEGPGGPQRSRCARLALRSPWTLRSGATLRSGRPLLPGGALRTGGSDRAGWSARSLRPDRTGGALLALEATGQEQHRRQGDEQSGLSHGHCLPFEAHRVGFHSPSIFHSCGAARSKFAFSPTVPRAERTGLRLTSDAPCGRGAGSACCRHKTSFMTLHIQGGLP